MSECSMNFAGKVLDFNTPKVMGILNVTPDSFSDGNELFLDSGEVSLDKALLRAEAMSEAGAAFIDIGGESTKPGAATVSLEEEIDRVLPLVELIHKNIDVIISVDTSSPEIMLQAASAGAGLINDVRALQRPGAIEAVSKIDLPVCLMHMQGSPATMQEAPRYDNLVNEVISFLDSRILACTAAGIDRNQIIVDPGFGFGKTLEHNLELLGRLSEFEKLKLPLLVGLSRKAMLGLITGKSVRDRKAASIAAAVIALMKGANIIRTHDVPDTVDAMKVYQAV